MTKTSAQLAAITAAAAILAQRLSWAKFDDDNLDDRVNQIKVDGPAAYRAWYNTLAEAHKDEEKIPVAMDQYWLTVVRECIKLDVQLALAGSALDPRVCGEVLQIRITRAEGFELAGKKTGRGEHAALKGYEARAHFAVVRGKAALTAAVLQSE